MSTSTSFKGCCCGIGFWFEFWFFSWADSSHGGGTQGEQGEPEPGQPGLRQPAGHKDACHVLLLLTQRSLSFHTRWVLHQWEDLVLRTEINVLNCSVTDKTWLLYQFVQALWPPALVQQTSKGFLNLWFFLRLCWKYYRKVYLGSIFDLAQAKS